MVANPNKQGTCAIDERKARIGEVCADIPAARLERARVCKRDAQVEVGALLSVAVLLAAAARRAERRDRAHAKRAGVGGEATPDEVVLDLSILVKTVWKVFRRDGIGQEGHFSSSEFMGPGS